MLHLILLVFSFVLAVIAALVAPVPIGAWPRLHFGWLALAFLVAALLFGGGGAGVLR